MTVIHEVHLARTKRISVMKQEMHISETSSLIIHVGGDTTKIYGLND